MNPILAVGDKFAVLALSGTNATYDGPDFLDLGDGYFFSTRLPFEGPNFVKEQFGNVALTNLAKAQFVLWTAETSPEPKIFDDQNRKLRKKCYRFYLGLLVSVRYFDHAEMLQLLGAYPYENAPSDVMVRNFVQYERAWTTIGSPTTRVSKALLHEAAQFAQAIEQVEQQGNGERLMRILGTFRTACITPFLDVRLHQFVRVAEGFLHSNNNRQFADRAARVTKDGSKYYDRYKEMYLIRSATEHFRGALNEAGGTTTEEKRRTLTMRTIEAETLARFCLWEFLGNPVLLAYLHDEVTLEGFWSMPHKQMEKIWATRLVLAGATRDFDPYYSNLLHRYRGN